MEKEPKFKMFEKVFFMHDNEIKQDKIFMIKAIYYKGAFDRIIYYFTDTYKSLSHANVSEKNIYRSKEELIKSLTK